MIPPLDRLIELPVRDAQCIEDCVQLRFPGSTLTINNPITRAGSGANGELDDLQGRVFRMVELGDDWLHRGFGSDVVIRVDLRHGGYRSPEAMVLVSDDGEHIVW